MMRLKLRSLKWGVMLLGVTLWMSVALIHNCFADVTIGETPYDEIEESTGELPDETAFYDKAEKKIDSIYYDAVDAIMNDRDEMGGKNFTAWVFDGCYYAYRTVADMAPYLIVFSLLMGVVLCAVANKNKAFRKQVIVWFIILIPMVLIVFRFGIGMLIGVFG